MDADLVVPRGSVSGPAVPGQSRTCDASVVIDGEVFLEVMLTAAAPATAAGPALTSVEASRLPRPIRSRPTRGRLDFTAVANLSTAQQYGWFAALLRKHSELEPLFKVGWTRPYIMVREDVPFFTRLVTEGFLDIVVDQHTAARQYTVIIHNMPTYINVNLITTSENSLCLKPVLLVLTLAHNI